VVAAVAAPAPVGAVEAPGTGPAPEVAAGEPGELGVVEHYFGHAGAAIVRILSGELRVGDTLHFRGHTTDFYEHIERIEFDHQPIDVARAGQLVGVQVSQRVREHDAVFKVTDP
jgi:putative protease